MVDRDRNDLHSWSDDILFVNKLIVNLSMRLADSIVYMAEVSTPFFFGLKSFTVMFPLVGTFFIKISFTFYLTGYR
jgi:hypothetical protein